MGRAPGHIQGGDAWQKGLDRDAERERLKGYQLVPVKLTCSGFIEGTVLEGWIHPRNKWNGFEMPMMTETQLDALIKAQDPELTPDEAEKVFFDKSEGYSIQNEEGDCEKLHPIRERTPAGEILYDVANNWCWELAD